MLVDLLMIFYYRIRKWRKGIFFSLFTNKDRGCTEQELELLQKEIPLLYQGKTFTIWVLPRKYAHLPAETALDYFVPVSVGTT